MTTEAPEEFNGRIGPERDWREIVAWVGDLPPMPHVASRAISMVENPTTTAQELTDLLSSDTALAARVLKIANSAMFSRQREITTLSQAIMIIGFKALKGIIVAATLRQLNKNFGNIEQMIWENSMCTALSATTIAKKLRKSYVEEAFLFGLLHSLGQVVFLAQKDTAKDYKKVITLISEKNISYVDAETAIYGFAHPLIGALVAKKWNFSAETCQIILHYADSISFGSRPENVQAEKTALVALSDKISHLIGIGHPVGYPEVIPDCLQLIKYIGLANGDEEKILEELSTSIKDQFTRESNIYS